MIIIYNYIQIWTGDGLSHVWSKAQGLVTVNVSLVGI